MSTVTMVDYDCGNIFSLRHALEHCGATVRMASRSGDVVGAERLVLPGVGAFGDAMDKLAARGLIDEVRDFALSGRPFLGICVGMQLMFESDEEFGEHDGLGILSGRVVKIPETTSDGAPMRVPHIGWSLVEPAPHADWSASILPGDGTPFETYFVHSFHCQPTDPANMLAITMAHGRPITAAVSSGNCWGCQFHPEKSGEAGLDILRRFLAMGGA